MHPLLRYCIILSVSFGFIFAPAHAAHPKKPEEKKPPFGLAMNGAPKYGPLSPHLDYVNPAAPKGGVLRIAAIGSFDTVNPFSVKGVAAEGLSLVHDRLMQRVWDEPFTLYPLIAEKVDVAPDRSAITFDINPKAKFHDGRSITAEDVLFSYETLKEKGRPNMRRVYGLVAKAESLGPLRVRFSLKPGFDRETVMIIAMMPILSKAWWSTRNFDSNITEIPVMSGPYTITALEPGRRITYGRVQDYWAKDVWINRGQYNVDQITYEYFRDDTIALEAFKKGDLDLRREWDMNKWQTAYTPISGVSTEKLEIPHQRPERAHAMIFNLRRAPFDDIRVRQALSLAFDEAWIAKNLYHDKLKRIGSYFPNSLLDGSGPMSMEMRHFLEPFRAALPPEIFQERMTVSDLRPERERLRAAQALLKEAGWVIENGVRVNATTKKPFRFEMILSSAQEEKVALNFKRSLERLGIAMTIRTLDSASFQNRKSAYSYDMMMFFWQNSLSPGSEQALYWGCAAVQQEAQFNFAGICNPALEAAIKRLPAAQSYEELSLYARSIDRILLSEVISIPLFYKGTDYVAVRDWVKKPTKVPLYGFVMETLWVQPASPPSAKAAR